MNSDEMKILCLKQKFFLSRRHYINVYELQVDTYLLNKMKFVCRENVNNLTVLNVINIS